MVVLLIQQKSIETLLLKIKKMKYNNHNIKYMVYNNLVNILANLYLYLVQYLKLIIIMLWLDTHIWIKKIKKRNLMRSHYIKFSFFFCFNINIYIYTYIYIYISFFIFLFTFFNHLF
ncbi:hypothetical protein BJ944DRAFT_53061 [Cunninghamella echinulata]|nr:hypothetical protein BJ944DRAFT_53061 [Cunninghamella echinulata]